MLFKDICRFQLDFCCVYFDVNVSDKNSPYDLEIEALVEYCFKVLCTRKYLELVNILSRFVSTDNLQENVSDTQTDGFAEGRGETHAIVYWIVIKT